TAQELDFFGQKIQSGKTAQVWPPTLIDGEPFETIVALLQVAGHWLDENQVCMAQMFLESPTIDEETKLHEAGFDYLTDLLYLVCLECDFPHNHFSTKLQFEAYNSQNHQRLSRIVDATYQETLDCKKLGYLRRLEDVLAGYRAIGVFSPNNWLIVRHEDQDIGCLLMADHPQLENMELVYMGIIPTQRGHAWGLEVARHAQWIARQAVRARLVLAVDAANSPALRMYASAGFKAWDQRRVYYRVC
ncbi:MAG: GNAT family N-acetyltransferase, partial [Thermoguttaceae bacterium]